MNGIHNFFSSTKAYQCYKTENLTFKFQNNFVHACTNRDHNLNYQQVYSN